MRIDQNQAVCGLPATAARDVMRLFRVPRPDYLVTEWVDDDDIERLVHDLEREGWIQRARCSREGENWWQNTIRGNALAQASFCRPVMRATADRLLVSVVHRAEEYNADERYLLHVTEIVVFGSYLDPEAKKLGDVDLAVSVRNRTEAESRDEFADRRLSYAEASGRRFKSYFETLIWPETELIRHLRGGVPAIRITQEDARSFADRWKVGYTFPR